MIRRSRRASVSFALNVCVRWKDNWITILSGIPKIIAALILSRGNPNSKMKTHRYRRELFSSGRELFGGAKGSADACYKRVRACFWTQFQCSMVCRAPVRPSGSACRSSTIPQTTKHVDLRLISHMQAMLSYSAVEFVPNSCFVHS